MTSVQVKLDSSEVKRWLRATVPNGVAKATSRGLNKGAMQIRTLGSVEIRKQRNLKAGIIRKAMFIQRANPKSLSAKVVVGKRGGPRSLRRYGAKVVGRRGRGNKARGNAPVTVTVTPGNRGVVKGAFVRYKDGAVFKRVGLARFPVQFLFGPNLWSAFDSATAQRVMTNLAKAKVPNLIEHEMVRELKRGR